MKYLRINFTNGEIKDILLDGTIQALTMIDVLYTKSEISLLDEQVQEKVPQTRKGSGRTPGRANHCGRCGHVHARRLKGRDRCKHCLHVPSGWRLEQAMIRNHKMKKLLEEEK